MNNSKYEILNNNSYSNIINNNNDKDYFDINKINIEGRTYYKYKYKK